MFDRLIGRLSRWQIYRRTVRELAFQSDSTLRDIGIKRHDIKCRAAEDSGMGAR